MDLQRARGVAGKAVLVVICLGVVKGIVGYAAGSVALQADAVHTLADLLAILASWFGLTLALRSPTERFPYGYYRAETLAALVASAVIAFMGIGLLHEGVQRVLAPPVMDRPYLTMGMGCFSAVAALLISRWENAAARDANSQSLSATAAETRLDAVSSGLVLISGLAAAVGIPWLDGVIGSLIACVILTVGLANLKQSILSLMDASVNPELEKDITRTVGEVEGVRNVEKMILRRAGPFYFLDGHIRVAPSLEVARGHEIAHRAQSVVRDEFPSVEGIMFHVEPDASETPRILIPVTDGTGMDADVSTHFGRAPHFVLAKLNGENGHDFRVLENAAANREVRAGLAAIRGLTEKHHIDIVIVREIGEIAFHALRDNLIEVFRTDARTAREALDGFSRNELSPLAGPTHSSENKVDEEQQTG